MEPLRIGLLALQWVLMGLVAYNAGTAMWGWPNPVPPGPGARHGTRFRVVIPAHDEEAVIAEAVADLAAQDHASVAIWVVADRCTDHTAAIARQAGARVDERTAGEGGKGAALQWHLDRHPLEPGEALLIVDADNRLPHDLVTRIADELDDGAEAVQVYLDVTNPDASPLATAGAIAYWASNRMVQQARHRLGWQVDLGGTGMCITADALERAGGFADSLAEDADLGVRLALQGIRVRWIHDVRIRDEKPSTMTVAVRQRARWATGRRRVVRAHALPLLGAAFRRRSMRLLDLAIRLLQPSRTIVAAASGLAIVVAVAWPTKWLLEPWVWSIALAIQLILPIAFLIRDGVATRYVLRYPLLTLLAVLWLPIRIVSRLTRRWYHTPHRGSPGTE